jgi:hypothetical protein
MHDEASPHFALPDGVRLDSHFPAVCAAHRGPTKWPTVTIFFVGLIKRESYQSEPRTHADQEKQIRATLPLFLFTSLGKVLRQCLPICISVCKMLGPILNSTSK